MAIEREQLAWLHKTSSKHRGLIEASLKCGCFYCGMGFPSSAIKEWTDGGQTAFCPGCGVDSVLPGQVNKDILDAMRQRWFEESADVPSQDNGSR